MARNNVCPAKLAWSLDNIFRKWFHNPAKLLGSLVKENMTVLDVGCGPGLFSIEMAKMVGKSGKVIAADLQEEMLEKLAHKIQGKEVQNIITLHKCEENKIGVLEKVDFALAFYMVHEVPDRKNFFEELHTIIKSDGKLLVIEPNFHVSKKDFGITIEIAKAAGFKPVNTVKVFYSRAAELQNI